MQKEIIKADDCRCFKCNEILTDLFKLRLASNAEQRMTYRERVNRNIVEITQYGEKIYRHSKDCMKGKQ